LGLNKNEITLLENYKLLLGIIKNENKMFWDRNNVFLTLNSSLLAASVFLFSLFSSVLTTLYLRLGAFTICILGTVFSIVWLYILNKARIRLNHWVSLAREIEEPEFNYSDFSTENRKLNNLCIFRAEDTFVRNVKFYEKAKTMKIALIIPAGYIGAWLFLVLWILFLPTVFPVN